MSKFHFLTLLALITHFGVAPLHANTLKCVSDKRFIPEGENSELGVEENFTAECDQGLRIVIRGLGLNARALFGNAVAIQCPLKRHLEGNYYGANATVAAAGGVHAAVFVGKGVCFLAGVNIGIGASLAGSRLTILHD